MRVVGMALGSAGPCGLEAITVHHIAHGYVICSIANLYQQVTWVS